MTRFLLLRRHARRVATWRSLALAVLLALPVAAPAARAQSFPDSAFDAATTARLRRLLADSYAAGLPEAPLLNRILQGAARHVDGGRVLALVRAHADSMRAALTALGTRASADEIDAGASALHAGATRSALHRLRTVRSEGTATTAIVVLTDLLWRGVPSGDAAEAVTELASRSNDKALLALQGAVARDGAPASPQRLQSLIERISPPGDKLPSTATPGHRPVVRDTLETAPNSASPATPRVSGARASIALSSLSAPSDDSPRAVLGEGTWTLPFGTSWSVTPGSALRIDEDGTRWSASVSLDRRLQPLPTLGARLWMSGELRSPVARSRSELPLNPDLGASAIPRGRSRDMSLRAGTDLHRKVGGWRVTGQFAVGHLRYSSLETTFVPREVPIVPDTQTPRPDTLGTRTILEPQNVWRILGASTAQGGVTLQRGAYRIEGNVVRRLQLDRRTNDSLASGRRTLLIVGAERQFSPRVAIVGQWSSHDPALVTGSLSLHDARWRLGARISSPARRPLSTPQPERVEKAPSERALAIDLRVDSAAGEGVIAGSRVVRLRVQLRGARSVQVEGDLTGWTAKALTRESDGTFSGTFVVAGPIVRLRVRADGGAWVTPAGAPVQRDDFGDLVAVYVLRG